MAVVGLVALAACGSSDDAGTSAGGGDELGKVTLGFSAWPGWFPWQVAEEKGIFAQHGLDVDLRYFESYTDSLNALATGNVDANSQTLNDTLSSVAGGSKQTIVLVNDNSTGNDQIIAARRHHRASPTCGARRSRSSRAPSTTTCCSSACSGRG